MSLSPLVVTDEFKGLRLDVFLSVQLTDCPSRTFAKKLIEDSLVLVNGQRVRGCYKTKLNDEILVTMPAPKKSDMEAENIPLDIIYEDDEIIVINKPSGLTVHPAKGHRSGTLVNALLYHTQELSDVDDPLRQGIVHRLDKETSGIMIVAKTDLAHAQLSEQFESREVHKCYVALVDGEVAFDEGQVEAPIGKHLRYHDRRSVDWAQGKDAFTKYQVIKRTPQATLLALYPTTGRTHQLRVHLAHIHHPILGDGKYGRKESFSRLALHARSITFTHPRTNAVLTFTTRIPDLFMKQVGLGKEEIAKKSLRA